MPKIFRPWSRGATTLQVTRAAAPPANFRVATEKSGPSVAPGSTGLPGCWSEAKAVTLSIGPKKQTSQVR